MAILGGTLAALLFLALVFLGVMIYKQYRKPVKYLIRKKVSAFLYLNLSYKVGSEEVLRMGWAVHILHVRVKVINCS